ncbi:methyltransferase n6amt1 like protein [Babesia gibsoni]|uniref:Methyltransferase n6amt1 like protein n=1 Tax=Babesia gibsoni TaxID=33632 RepID=A0AAD8LSC6_BABGI|nr:methyltransferase n6amt1 like protein [Babesia gibsoni]
MAHLDADCAHVDSQDYRGKVYSPSDDTFLFVDALQSDVDCLLSREILFAIEIGCGSGYISTCLLKLLKGVTVKNASLPEETESGHSRKNSQCSAYTCDTSVPFVLTVDINRVANVVSLETARRNAVGSHLDTITMDMFASLCKQRSRGMVDLIMFNPPYVPSSEEEPPYEDIDAAWNGGFMGRDVIDRFIRSVGDYLSQDGIVYLLVEKRNDVPDVFNMLRDHGFHPAVS